MSDISPEEFSRRLISAAQGNAGSAEDLLPLVYDELRAIAHSQRRRQFGADTLRTTALVHEAFLRLAGPTEPDWEGRSHFLGVAASAMRRVLSDYARDSRAAKRGGAWGRVTLGAAISSDKASDVGDVDLVALDDALTRLAEIDPRQSRIVELRYLTGMSVEETAEVVEVSTRTVEREWRAARAWLSHQIAQKREA